MNNVLILLPDGDFERFKEFVFDMKYRGAYLYHIDKKCWYQWKHFAGPDWLPINDGEVPDNYKSRLQLILLLS